MPRRSSATRPTSRLQLASSRSRAYHAGIIRSTLYGLGYETPALYGAVQKISDVRDSVDGRTDDDQGIGNQYASNLVPTDSNSIAYSRSAAQVLNVVYLTGEAVTRGGFFPHGVNGAIRRSGDFDYDGD